MNRGEQHFDNQVLWVSVYGALTANGLLPNSPDVIANFLVVFPSNISNEVVAVEDITQFASYFLSYQ